MTGSGAVRSVDTNAEAVALLEAAQKRDFAVWHAVGPLQDRTLCGRDVIAWQHNIGWKWADFADDVSTCSRCASRASLLTIKPCEPSCDKGEPHGPLSGKVNWPHICPGVGIAS